MFAKHRASKEKSQNTLEASTKALEAAEESARRQVQEAQIILRVAPKSNENHCG